MEDDVQPPSDLMIQGGVWNSSQQIHILPDGQEGEVMEDERVHNAIPSPTIMDSHWKSYIIIPHIELSPMSLA